MSVKLTEITEEQRERIVTLVESGCTMQEAASLEDVPLSRVRSVTRAYREQVNREWDEILSREHHEEWRDYGEGVYVRWSGPVRLAVFGDETTGYGFSLRWEERRIFDSSSRCYSTRREAKDAADRQAKSHRH